ncbi:response regulator [Phenylobacterium sp.]|uniref:response regulator n=1 Tax=Phenylobacterium sp. TaxID=1871053 RepID=UPI0025FDD9CB|nr:response regulator [Phenylobacterium sp.]
MSSDLRVLVVDDHPVNRLVLSEIFTHLGCDVCVAEDGAQALTTSSVDHFDLICLDRHMPGLSGDEVACSLPDEQFVLAWSTDLADLPDRFNGTLSKPVSLLAVQGAILRARAWRDRIAVRSSRLPPAAAA